MAPHPDARFSRSGRWLAWAAYLLAALCLLPVVAVAAAAIGGSFETGLHLAQTQLPRYVGNTLLLTAIVAAGAAAIGTGAAWLVTMTRFPGVRILEYALVLPLAFPAYVLAYAYTTFLSHPGPVQSLLREVTGWGPRDYWFPEIRSLPGAALMLIMVLYVYVYLLARASFISQSGTAYMAARVLGHGPWSTFLRVSLPMARPAIAGGMLLAVMETIADIGTVAHFGVPTFATGIYQTWFSMGDRAAAAQLAFALLSIALFLALFERLSRGRAQHHNTGRRFEVLAPMELRGLRAGGAFFLCALPVIFGFLLPTVLLLRMALSSEQDLFSARYLGFIVNSMTLASIAAILTVAACAVLRFNARLSPTRGARAAVEIARVGYAVPGGVIALGLFVPVAAFDNVLDAWMRATFGISSGLLLSGGIGLLLLAYFVRFAAVALNALDGGLATVSSQIHWAARTLGAGTGATVRRVLLPAVMPAALTGALIVFVDVMKELPATLILRPFDFDTLAVQAFRLAADERLNGAAVPSLLIVAFGFIPVLLIMRRIARHRPVTGAKGGAPLGDAPQA